MDEKMNDQLTAMRILTEWTGDVSEAQVKTLNLWPAVMIPGLASHEIHIDLNDRKVVFKLKFKKGKTIENLNLLSRLETGVWALLGDTWKTIVKKDRRFLYTGVRKKEFNGTTGSFGQGRAGFDPKGVGSVPQVPRKR
jgi:hypothetical protein